MNNDVRNVVLGDYWFASVKVCVLMIFLLNCDFFLVVNNCSKYYPKQFIEDTMESFPSGTDIVLESVNDGTELVSIGYKYNYKRVICFIGTKGFAPTTAGVPYLSRFVDNNNHLIHRNVQIPEACSVYYHYSNLIDIHNQTRQNDLKLEKYWVTTDGYFIIWTTMLGICITDSWKVMCLYCILVLLCYIYSNIN